VCVETKLDPFSGSKKILQEVLAVVSDWRKTRSATARDRLHDGFLCARLRIQLREEAKSLIGR